MGLTIICPAWHVKEEPRADVVWDGAYPAFNRLRQEVARAAGGSFPPHKPDPRMPESMNDNRYWLGEAYTHEKAPGLHHFLEHSDCGGEISPEMCALVARDLRKILPEVKARAPMPCGHLLRNHGYYGGLWNIVRACIACAEAGKPLLFR